MLIKFIVSRYIQILPMIHNAKQLEQANNLYDEGEM